MQYRRIATALSTLSVVAIVLTSCGDAAGTKADFRAIDAVVSTLHVSDLGQVAVDRTSGKRQVIEGQTPTRTIGVMTENMTSDEVQAAIDARLHAAGYTTTPRPDPLCVNGGCSYHHPTNRVAINMTIYEPGEQIGTLDAEGKPTTITVSPNHVGLWLTLHTI